MEPNKLNTKIREKLNAREIQPSAASWDRLDAMLSVEENKKSRKSFKWLYMAASIVGFVFAGLFFFNQNNEIPKIDNNETVVEAHSDEVNSKNVKASEEKVLQTNETIKNQNEIEDKALASVSESREESVKGNKSETSIQSFTKTEIIKQEVVAEVVPQKIDEKPKEETVSNVLLASNEANKTEKRSSNKSKIKIDASALLSQVDGEIELTFRQKTIKKMVRNFESAREAVVSRNQE